MVMYSYGDGTFQDQGLVLNNWCWHKGAYSSFADVNGDGRADFLCDDSDGNHWAKIV
jgi:hypothetical protein